MTGRHATSAAAAAAAQFGAVWWSWPACPLFTHPPVHEPPSDAVEAPHVAVVHEQVPTTPD